MIAHMPRSLARVSRYLSPSALATKAVESLPAVLQRSPDLDATLAVLAADPVVVKALGGRELAQFVLGLAVDRVQQTATGSAAAG